jgi:enamine deaminase RidA (YjgF/YER057c/UK114 family)
MTRQSIDPSGHHMPTGYAHAVVVAGSGRTIYVAGQVALDAGGAVVGPGDPERQLVQVFENLRMVLRACGADLHDLVKTTVLLTHSSYRDIYRSVRLRYLTEPYPASTLAIVTSLAMPELLCEIEGVAVLD